MKITSEMDNTMKQIKAQIKAEVCFNLSKAENNEERPVLSALAVEFKLTGDTCVRP